jgi:Ribbon-helix-helix protein, copG family
MYDDVHKAKGGAVAHLTLDLPQELIAELEKRAGKSGKSIPNFIREELELRYLHRLPERKKGDISDRPEFRQAIKLQDELRRRHEGSGYSGSAAVRQMRDRDNPKYED